LLLQHLEEDSSDGGINEISQQLAFSDLILLNKTDLIDRRQMERVKQAVRRINQSATLHECQLNQEGGRPPLSLLLENNGFSVNKALKVDPEFLHSDSGSDLDNSDSDSDVDSDGEGAAEAGVVAGGEGGVDDVPSQPKSAAAAAAGQQLGKSAEAEGSSAPACCDGSKQQEQAEADSSQLTSTTAVNSIGRKRSAPHTHEPHSHAGHASTGEQYCKVSTWLPGLAHCDSTAVGLAFGSCLSPLRDMHPRSARQLVRCLVN
jgi:G3E family GTPase